MERKNKIFYYIAIIFTIIVVLLGLNKEFMEMESSKDLKLFSINDLTNFAENSKYTYTLKDLESGVNKDILFITDSDGSNKTEYGLAISENLSNDKSIRAIVLTKNQHIIFIDNYIFDNGFYKFNLTLYNDDIDIINIVISDKPIYLLK